MGLSEAEARGVLAAAGLGVAVYIEPFFDEEAERFGGDPGVVWQQSPAAGTTDRSTAVGSPLGTDGNLPFRYLDFLADDQQAILRVGIGGHDFGPEIAIPEIAVGQVPE